MSTLINVAFYIIQILKKAFIIGVINSKVMKAAMQKLCNVKKPKSHRSNAIYL